MLVEISDKTLEEIRNYKKDREVFGDMSIEEFREFQLRACYACNGMLQDIDKAEQLIKRSGK